MLRLTVVLMLLFVWFGRTPALVAVEGQPNVLFIIADDASRHFGQAYDCDWVRTPNIDRLASEGLVFDNAYVPTSKCAPCRAALLTGRNPWQLEEAGNHQCFFPAKYVSFAEILRKCGVHCGSAGKTWGPGIARHTDGKARDFGLPPFGSRRDPPAESFAKFLAARSDNVPFFYWHGSSDPHRGYKAGSGLEAGKQLADIDHVPAYWPDNDVIRGDMLDYAMEVERFDTHVGQLLQELERAGETDNTLVIVTSDHGMPFPRVKGHTYDDAHRVPLVMRWPKGIRNPGRRVSDLISFIDFAPTFLELFEVPDSVESLDMTGRSLTDVLRNSPQLDRSFVLIGRERNDVFARPGSAHGLGYPARGIRSGDLLYVRNYEPARWPCGNEESGFRDTDASPTKSLIERLGSDHPFWQHAFGKRPAEQLFDVNADPDCVNNLADNPDYESQMTSLRKQMTQELKRQQDPRALGQGAVFDNYLSVKSPPQSWDSR